MIRLVNERTEIKASAFEWVDSVYVREGARVQYLFAVYELLQAKQRLAGSRSQAAQAKYGLAYKLMVYEYYYNSVY